MIFFNNNQYISTVIYSKLQTLTKTENKIINGQYNGVMKLEISLNNIQNIYPLMSAYEAPKTTVRDLLTQQEVNQLLQLRSPALIAMWKRSKSMNDQSGFCGYYPLNAGVDQNVLTVHRLEDQSLDVLKDFCTGG